MERPFIIMRKAKVGYLDGKRRDFLAGEAYQVDETLFQAFVRDLKIAEPFDPRRPEPGKSLEIDPQASASGDAGAVSDAETEDVGAPRRRGRKRRGAG